MFEFISQNEAALLRWLHILAMVYWLGGEWGVFQTSYKVVNPALAFDERRRHMETAYRIDLLARTGIISLLPLGIHMGYLYNLHPYGGAWLWLVWGLWAALMVVTFAAFMTRGQSIWALLSGIEDWSRYLLIPSLLIVGGLGFVGQGPLTLSEGQHWYAAKIVTYGAALVIGVILRLIMHEWQKMFAVLAQGPNESVEIRLKRSIGIGRSVAYVYWVLISGACFFAAVKPF
jgi:hypothetical protein